MDRLNLVLFLPLASYMILNSSSGKKKDKNKNYLIVTIGKQIGIVLIMFYVSVYTFSENSLWIM